MSRKPTLGQGTRLPPCFISNEAGPAADTDGPISTVSAQGTGGREEELGLASLTDAGSCPGAATLSPKDLTLLFLICQMGNDCPSLQVAMGLTEIVSVRKSGLDFRSQI